VIVYVIINIAVGKRYVGQTTKTLEFCWQGHLAQARTGRRDMPLLDAIREYGAAAFTKETAQVCSSQYEMNYAERAWIERLGTIIPDGYNASFGIWRHPRQNARISAALMGRPCTWGAKIAAAQRGIPATEAQRAVLVAGREAWRRDSVLRSREARRTVVGG
jgi:GIY-YIG catalytic domain